MLIAKLHSSILQVRVDFFVYLLVSGAQLFNKPLITDNLMKNLHEDDYEPGEVNIHNIFKA